MSLDGFNILRFDSRLELNLVLKNSVFHLQSKFSRFNVICFGSKYILFPIIHPMFMQTCLRKDYILFAQEIHGEWLIKSVTHKLQYDTRHTGTHAAPAI